MKYYTGELYSKNINGKVIVWSANVTDRNEFATISINTGQLDGNIRTITKNVIVGKNIGKSNATTPFTQAVKEIKSKYKDKLKHGYKHLSDLGDDIATLDLNGSRLYDILDTRLSINKTDANNVLKPMKAVQFKNVKKFHFPYIVQPKINGVRSTLLMIKDLDNNNLFSNNTPKIKLLSKEGLEYNLPHITNLNESLFKDNIVLDGELYNHGELLSNIRRRIPIIKNGKISKHSLDSNKVSFYCFDLSIPDMSQQERILYKNNILHGTTNLNYIAAYNRFILNSGTPSSIINVGHVIAYNLNEVYNYLESALNSGFEGIILREFDAEYMFGGRKTNMIKLKKLLSGEFKIIDIIKKNEDNIRTYITFILENDINDKTFECTPEGNEEIRKELLGNKDNYIGKYVTATYYERTITGLPFHAVGRIRDSFDMDINDLQVEL